MVEIDVPSAGEVVSCRRFFFWAFTDEFHRPG